MSYGNWRKIPKNFHPILAFFGLGAPKPSTFSTLVYAVFKRDIMEKISRTFVEDQNLVWDLPKDEEARGWDFRRHARFFLSERQKYLCRRHGES